MNSFLETLDFNNVRSIIKQVNKGERQLRSLKVNEVVEGAAYVGKVNGKLAPVKVLRIYEFGGRKHFSIRNLDTRRDTTFRSAAKLYTLVPLAPEPKENVETAIQMPLIAVE